MGKQANGYECERNSQTALAKWIEDRRKRARVPIKLDPKILEAYVGQYQYETPPNRILTVSREGRKLFVDIPKDFKSELFAESASKFFLKIRPIQETFVTFAKDKGQATHLEVVSNGRTSRAKRIK